MSATVSDLTPPEAPSLPSRSPNSGAKDDSPLDAAHRSRTGSSGPPPLGLMPAALTRGMSIYGGALVAPPVRSEEPEPQTEDMIFDEAFCMLDSRGGGFLTMDAVYEFCESLPQPRPSQTAVRKLFMKFDTDGSSNIDAGEFLGFCKALEDLTEVKCAKMLEHYTKSMYRRLFEIVDDDGGGEIDRDELRQLLDGIGPILDLRVSGNDVVTLMRGHRSLDFDQFCHTARRIAHGFSITRLVAAFEETKRRQRANRHRAMAAYEQDWSAAKPKGPKQPLVLPSNLSSGGSDKGGTPQLISPLMSAQDADARAKQITELTERVAALTAECDSLREAVSASAAEAVAAKTAAANAHVAQMAAEATATAAKATVERRHAAARAEAANAALRLPGPVDAALHDIARHALADNARAAAFPDALKAPLHFARSQRFAAFASAVDGVAVASGGSAADIERLAGDVANGVQRSKQSGAQLRAVLSMLLDADKRGDGAHAALVEALDSFRAEFIVASDGGEGAAAVVGSNAKPPRFAPTRALDERLATLRTRLAALSDARDTGANGPRDVAAFVVDATAEARSALGDSAAVLGAFLLPAPGVSGRRVVKVLGAVAALEAATQRLLDTATVASRYASGLPTDAETLARAILSELAPSAPQTATPGSGGSSASLGGTSTAAVFAGTRQRSASLLASGGPAARTLSEGVLRALTPEFVASLRRDAQRCDEYVAPAAIDDLHKVLASSVTAVERVTANATLTTGRRDRGTQVIIDGPVLGLGSFTGSPNGDDEAAAASAAVGPPFVGDARAFRVSAAPRGRLIKTPLGDPVKHLDNVLGAYVANGDLPVPRNFARLEATSNIFQFGTRRIEVTPLEKNAVVKVGGGYLLFDEFCRHYAERESRHCIFADQRRSAAPRGPSPAPSVGARTPRSPTPGIGGGNATPRSGTPTALRLQTPRGAGTRTGSNTPRSSTPRVVVRRGREVHLV